MSISAFNRARTGIMTSAAAALLICGSARSTHALSQPESGATWATNVYPLGITGTNVEIAFVEAYVAPYTYRINPRPTNGWAGEYWPSTNVFLGKTITYYDAGDPLNTNYSSHATKVALQGAGNPLGWGSLSWLGTAHGATNIHNHAADHFINHYLALNSNPPGQSFSLAFTTTTNNQEALTAAMDRMVDRYGKIVVIGLRPIPSTAEYGGNHPAGIGAAYNIITVGCTDSSYTNWGGSTQYGPALPFGNAKPELLTAATSGSEAAGRGAGIAALLLHQAARDGWTNGSDPRVIKAIMLAGARKTTPWDKGLPGPDDDHSVPLDYYAGAGIAHCLNNYGIMFGGEMETGSTNVRAAWDFGVIHTNQTNVYFISVPQTNIYVSAVLAWHRRVGTTTNLPNIDLKLYSATNGAPDELLDWSTSRIDSVQHIYWKTTTTGLHALAVDGSLISTSEYYGLAFNFVGTEDTPLLDADADGLPDDWERAQFTEIYHYHADDDPDGDDAVNYMEFMADTDPNDPASVFVIALSREDNEDVAIGFVSSTGRQYKIVYNDNYYATNAWTWTVATTNWFPGSGSQTNWVDDGSETGAHPSEATGRLYRARVTLR